MASTGKMQKGERLSPIDSKSRRGMGEGGKLRYYEEFREISRRHSKNWFNYKAMAEGGQGVVHISQNV